VAVIVAMPLVKAVTSPTEDTVATLASDDRHAAVVVTFCDVPSERVAVALS
jgi:hypothetical protein